MEPTRRHTMEVLERLLTSGLSQVRRSLQQHEGESKADQTLRAKSRLVEIVDALQKKIAWHHENVAGENSPHESSLNIGHKRDLVQILIKNPGTKRETAKKIVNELCPTE